MSSTGSMAGIRRRILLTADTVGGVWTYAVELARWLDGRGIELQPVSMVRFGFAGVAMLSGELAERLRQIRVDLYGERGGSEMARRLGVEVDPGQVAALARSRSCSAAMPARVRAISSTR